MGTWWPQPPGFGNPFAGHQHSERRRKEEVVASSSPDTESRVAGGLAGGGGGGSGSRLDRRDSIGCDADCDDDGEARVLLERCARGVVGSGALGLLT